MHAQCCLRICTKKHHKPNLPLINIGIITCYHFRYRGIIFSKLVFCIRVALCGTISPNGWNLLLTNTLLKQPWRNTSSMILLKATRICLTTMVPFSFTQNSFYRESSRYVHIYICLLVHISTGFVHTYFMYNFYYYLFMVLLIVLYF